MLSKSILSLTNIYPFQRKSLAAVSIANFGFFNGKISEKFGQKCCRYNQNGKPLSKEVVTKTYESLKTFLPGWKVNEDFTRLEKYFYLEDYLKAVEFISKVALVDSIQTRNTPSF